MYASTWLLRKPSGQAPAQSPAEPPKSPASPPTGLEPLSIGDAMQT